METTVINNPLRKKTIELPENILRDLTIKARAKGMSLKKYVENILRHDAEDIDDSKVYARLTKEDPDGLISAAPEEQEAFKKWLGI